MQLARHEGHEHNHETARKTIPYTGYPSLPTLMRQFGNDDEIDDGDGDNDD